MIVDPEGVSIVYLAAYDIPKIDCEPAAHVQVITAWLINVSACLTCWKGSKPNAPEVLRFPDVS
jgi:hypothetical protein